MTRFTERFKSIVDLMRSRVFTASVFLALVCCIILVAARNYNTYYIDDGEQLHVVDGFMLDRETALAQAGFEQSSDAVGTYARLSSNSTLISIDTIYTVTVKADGRESLVPTSGESVGSILGKAGITLNASDKISVPTSEFTRPDMTIEISRVGFERVTQTEQIPYKKIRHNNASINYGTENIKQQGAYGSRETTYEVYFEDGVEKKRTLISQQVLKNPVDEIIEVGTGGTVTSSGETFRYKRVLEVTATAYSTEGWTSKRTATGTIARVGAIAVDPKVIPLGSKLHITSLDGKSWVYGYAVAEDTGGAIKGNKIDLFFNTQAECRRFGVRKAKVYILE